MDWIEIILLVAGGIIFTLSFLLPDKKSAAGMSGVMTEKEVRELLSREAESLRDRMDEMSSDAVERTERALERLSNEKIMAVSEYSDTVLSEIRRNHEEAMFLYDMLNNKQVSLKTMAADVNRAVKDAEAAKTSLRELAAETERGHAQKETAPVPPPVEKSKPEPARKAKPPKPPEKDGSASSPETEAADGNNNDKIRELYRQGKSAIAIAKELGLGVGEVRLVLDLYKKS